MASHKEEEPEQFKVVDRRLFTQEGERRTDIEEVPEPSAAPPKHQQASPQAGPSAISPRPSVEPDPAKPTPGAGPDKIGEEPPAAGAGMPQGPIQFEHLVMSLISQAMYQLGMAAAPGQPPPRPDLPAAQETIDLLGVLRTKTKGNLTPEEDHLLTGGLQELQLAFVELSRRTGRIR